MKADLAVCHAFLRISIQMSLTLTLAPYITISTKHMSDHENLMRRNKKSIEFVPFLQCLERYIFSTSCTSNNFKKTSPCTPLCFTRITPNPLHAQWSKSGRSWRHMGIDSAPSSAALASGLGRTRLLDLRFAIFKYGGSRSFTTVLIFLVIAESTTMCFHCTRSMTPGISFGLGALLSFFLRATLCTTGGFTYLI